MPPSSLPTRKLSCAQITVHSSWGAIICVSGVCEDKVPWMYLSHHCTLAHNRFSGEGPTATTLPPETRQQQCQCIELYTGPDPDQAVLQPLSMASCLSEASHLQPTCSPAFYCPRGWGGGFVAAPSMILLQAGGKISKLFSSEIC
jgi:hypothetical protein